MSAIPKPSRDGHESTKRPFAAERAGSTESLRPEAWSPDESPPPDLAFSSLSASLKGAAFVSSEGRVYRLFSDEEESRLADVFALEPFDARLDTESSEQTLSNEPAPEEIPVGLSDMPAISVQAAPSPGLSLDEAIRRSRAVEGVCRQQVARSERIFEFISPHPTGTESSRKTSPSDRKSTPSMPSPGKPVRPEPTASLSIWKALDISGEKDRPSAAPPVVEPAEESLPEETLSLEQYRHGDGETGPVGEQAAGRNDVDSGGAAAVRMIRLRLPLLLGRRPRKKPFDLPKHPERRESRPDAVDPPMIVPFRLPEPEQELEPESELKSECSATEPVAEDTPPESEDRLTLRPDAPNDDAVLKTEQDDAPEERSESPDVETSVIEIFETETPGAEMPDVEISVAETVDIAVAEVSVDAVPEPRQPACPADATVRGESTWQPAWPPHLDSLKRRAPGQIDGLSDHLEGLWKARKKVVCFNGFRRGDGCTTLLLCAARELARRGFHVLTVDAHPENPDLPGLLDAPFDAEFCRIVLLENRLEFLHWSDEVIEIDTPRGKTSQTFGELVATLRDDYDFILLDNGCLDASSLDRRLRFWREAHSDGVLLIVNTKNPDAAGLRDVARRLRRHEVELLGIAENYV